MHPALVKAAAGSSTSIARRALPGCLAVLAVAACVPLMLVLLLLAPDTTTTPAAAATCVTIDASGTSSTGKSTSDLGDGWEANTATILTVVATRFPGPDRARAGVVALATAMQESRLSNLTYGDRDSLGLFQQRPSMGWGTPAQILDPTYSTGRFLDALQGVPGWQSMPVTVAAQRVQRSAYPSAYAPWEQLATDLAAGAGAASCGQPVTATGGWAAPMAPGSYRLTSPYGWRTHPIHGVGKMHAGTDLAAPTGTPVYAAHDGTATVRYDPGGYGNYIDLTAPDGVTTRYGHLSVATTASGQPVTAGTLIGRVGSTGASTGPHLHLEVRQQGQPVDPVPYLAGKGLPL